LVIDQPDVQLELKVVLLMVQLRLLVAELKA
jgi:hypothetical protein